MVGNWYVGLGLACVVVMSVSKKENKTKNTAAAKTLIEDSECRIQKRLRHCSGYTHL